MIRKLQDTFRIPLTQNQTALVDEQDWRRLTTNRWYAWWCPSTKSFYARRSIRLPNERWTKQYMHREILGLRPGDPEQVDHKNHDTLDNRRSNLKKTDNRGNSENQRNQSEHGAGVQKMPSGRFRSHARVNGRRTYLGTFDTPQLAQASRQKFLEAHK